LFDGGRGDEKIGFGVEVETGEAGEGGVEVLGEEGYGIWSTEKPRRGLVREGSEREDEQVGDTAEGVEEGDEKGGEDFDDGILDGSGEGANHDTHTHRSCRNT